MNTQLTGDFNMRSFDDFADAGGDRRGRVGVSIQARGATLLVDARCTLGEGIVWDERRGALLWTDIRNSQLWIHSRGAGVTRTWALPDRLGSLAVCESGRLLLGLAKGLCLADIDGAGASGPLDVTPLVSVESTECSTRVNDGRTDRAGNFVFGTMNEHPDKAPIGRFYQFSMRDGLRPLDLGTVAIPNSICFSPDGRTMYYCDSLERRIMQCDYDADDAGVTNVREFVRCAAIRGLPDGSVVDAGGYVWNAVWGSACVRRYTPEGTLDCEIGVPVKNPTCVAFGGPGLSELYVTSSREEMTAQELEGTPHAGGIFFAVPRTVCGLADQKFRDC